MNKSGFVYILTSPAMSYVKIGMTQRTVEERVLDLNRSTSLPLPFEIAYAIASDDCHDLEQRVHQALVGNRTNMRREFFEVSPVQAIRCIENLAGAPSTIGPREANREAARAKRVADEAKRAAVTPVVLQRAHQGRRC